MGRPHGAPERPDVAYALTIMDKGKVLMAMSGGIDSTVAAMLLTEQGYKLEGVTFRSWDSISKACMERETGCCSVDSIFEAKHVAENLGFNHQILDVRELFRNTVISNFISEYLNGRTPNPCVVCNKIIKWGALCNLADSLGCQFIATGHYARIGSQNGRYFISKGVDTTKDQSYFLWQVPHEKLSRTLFPLGNYTKQQVRQMAAERGYVKLSQKRESQEICFVPDNNYRNFLRGNSPEYTAVGPGNFVSTDGRVLGQHKGFPNYTIGQRKGLEIALGQPMYVSHIDAARNTVTLGTRADLLSRSLTASNYNFTKIDAPASPIEVTARVRYRSKGCQATVAIRDGKAVVEFSEPVESVSPGQSVVFYQGDDMIGGGIID